METSGTDGAPVWQCPMCGRPEHGSLACESVGPQLIIRAPEWNWPWPPKEDDGMIFRVTPAQYTEDKGEDS